MRCSIAGLLIPVVKVKLIHASLKSSCHSKPVLRQRQVSRLVAKSAVTKNSQGQHDEVKANQRGTEPGSVVEEELVDEEAEAVLEQSVAQSKAVQRHRKLRSRSSTQGVDASSTTPEESRVRYSTRPLPRVLMVHTGGTLGMDPEKSFEMDSDGRAQLKAGGTYGGLKAEGLLTNLLQVVPELTMVADLDLQVVFNKDSSRVGPPEWILLARTLHKNRHLYDAFVVVHGTDTMAYTASALSMMLQGFRKPIVLTGSQLPLLNPRSDARQNLIDSLTCATASFTPPHTYLQEVAICFGGKLMRGNRSRKVNSSGYQAFDSPAYPHLATLGIDIDWNDRYLLKVEGGYHPRFKLNPQVIRVPIVPGSDPRQNYGDLVGRGVKGVVLEAFGVGNMPDTNKLGWMPWLREQTKKGLQVYLASQCSQGPLHPELYKAGAMALEMGIEPGPQMTPETACVKMMLCLCYPDIPLSIPLAGEL